MRENPAKDPVRETGCGKPRSGKDSRKLPPNAKGAGWDAQATPWSGKIGVLVTSLDQRAFPAIVIPMLMAGVGRQVQSGGRGTVKVSVLHEEGDLIAHAVTRISNELHRIRAITERWTVDSGRPFAGVC
ncbi:MAG: hypothetical protein Q8Q59_08070 [Luteolibacter sp.]|nr:hypothetical protein [Luteolibacter sp.]